MAHTFDPVGWRHAGRVLNDLRRRFGEDVWSAGLRELTEKSDFPGEGSDVPAGHQAYPCRGCIDRWAKRAAKIMASLAESPADQV